MKRLLLSLAALLFVVGYAFAELQINPATGKLDKTGTSRGGAGTLFVAGQKPDDNALTNGRNATQSLIILGGEGGNTTISTTGVGGVGSGIHIQGGPGGLAPSAATSSTGGKGGTIHLLGGAGGQAKAAGANIGGDGGDLILEGGAVGIGTGGTSASNGRAGRVYILGGVGNQGAREDILIAMQPNGIRSGMVGIGTTSPLGGTVLVDTYVNATGIYETLMHNGSTSTTAQSRVSVQNNVASSAVNMSMVAYGSGNTASSFGVTLGSYTALFATGASNNGLIIATQGITKPIMFGVNATERMRIHSDGNVGIGTISPGATLDVSGSIRSVAGASVGVGACWCTTPPKVLGYCTGALGTCSACNYNGSGC